MFSFFHQRLEGDEIADCGLRIVSGGILNVGASRETRDCAPVYWVGISLRREP